MLEEGNPEFTVKAMNVVYPLEGVPQGWEALTHPEGALYFFHPDRRIYTNAYLCDHETYAEIEDFAALLDDMLKVAKVELPPDAELALELEDNLEQDPPHHWCYYYVNHAARALFWLQDYEVTQDIVRLKGVKTASHISM